MIDIIQIAGRALRPHGDADTATIIVPALLPDSPGDGAVPGDGGRYQHVLRVVRALCAHDDTLSAGLGAARASRAPDGGGGPGGQQMPAQITVQAPDGTLARTLDALRVRITGGTASSWWDGYGHARAYHDQHGSLDTPTTHVTAGGFRLGTWLTAQRAERNSGTLPAGRIGHLDQIGMIWDRLEDAWMSAYQELRAFNDQHGHFEVPLDYRTADGIRLAEWQGTQRDAGRAGKMTASRRALLDQIGFPWDPAQARWMRRYHQLTDALARHGGPANLPAGSPEATWLEGQHLARHRGKLPDDKIALLEQAGIPVRRPDPWLAGYQALANFKAERGHLRVPDGYKTPGGINLSDWQRDQRVRRKAGRITAGQVRLLEEAGFCWDPIAEAWNARYQEAVAWKREHGHLGANARTLPAVAWTRCIAPGARRRRSAPPMIPTGHARTGAPNLTNWDTGTRGARSSRLPAPSRMSSDARQGSASRPSAPSRARTRACSSTWPTAPGSAATTARSRSA